MGVRFWRRVKIAPGLTLNLSKSGGSLSFGPRGAKYTVGPRGRRTTVGIPGTGLFYTQASSKRGSGRRKPTRRAELPSVPVKDRLSQSFFKRLVTPAGERAFIDGCRELSEGQYAAALPHFDAAAHLADAAFAAGFLHLKREQTDKAIPLLEQAVHDHRHLGSHFTKYGLELTLNLPVTEEIEAHVGPTLRGALLALVEEGLQHVLDERSRREPFRLREVPFRGGGFKPGFDQTTRLNRPPLTSSVAGKVEGNGRATLLSGNRDMRVTHLCPIFLALSPFASCHPERSEAESKDLPCHVLADIEIPRFRSG